MTLSSFTPSSSTSRLHIPRLQPPRPHMHDLEGNAFQELSSLSPGPLTPPPPYHEKYQRNIPRPSYFPLTLKRVTRRPRLLAAASILALFVGLSLFIARHVSSVNRFVKVLPEVVPMLGIHDTKEKSRVYPAQVLGAPTDSFKDNLRVDTKYITAWIGAGWTNDVMTYMNLLYIAQLTQRTAILPPFAPAVDHLSAAAGLIPVSRIFDLPRLSAALRIPIIEWADVKNENSTIVDELGCWSIWATAGSEKKPRNNPLESPLGLDIAYTPVPESTFLLPHPETSDPHTEFHSLASITFPSGRKNAQLPVSAPSPAPLSKHASLPNEQLACFDYPYYVASVRPYEHYLDWSPSWNVVGTQMHWTSEIESLAISFIRETFMTPEDEATPPFISIHVRHSDFKVYCPPETDCFAPLSKFAIAVEEVKAELRKKGVEVEKVLVTSDERDPKWWAEVREMGWGWVDHAILHTEERFGKWYPVFLDAVIQSLGSGFVGTDHSTMSLIAQRRVEDWNGGVAATREVQWGHW